MTRLRDLKKRLMEDPEFREEYLLADQEYSLVAQLVRAPDGGKAHAGRGSAVEDTLEEEAV